ncbi:hypothetical protein BDQ12DRAFT_82541 [Crucibulum laeve]|uniref:S-adenosyl-L-methionine dependent methyltransferase n=1 Tax=Crucibulum laeve TaxID=68775 RepID=A0A5C3M2A5_9AGAR|nr:hypothetical protein BDQ12DRAFT_82541 [Crucibulum laeve]
MHSRNPYKTLINFESLASAYPRLKAHLRTLHSGTKAIDFKDDVAQRRLTEAILFSDFGLKVVLPEDRLCPPVPNRMNYILWIQDIIDAYPGSSKRTVGGIDIGTGASAIYPLLGCKMASNWHFVATEIDSASYSQAVINIRTNKLEDRIQAVKATETGPILFPLFDLDENDVSYDFTMCNPPFYASLEEIEELALKKEAKPSAVCTGALTEMIYPGGEVAFVRQMVDESVKLGDKCRWYTSMLGRLSSVLEVVGVLRARKITNYAVTEFVQGQTRRWAVGWSFGDLRLPDSISRISHLPPAHSLYPFLPPKNTLRQTYPELASTKEAAHSGISRHLGRKLQEVLLDVLREIECVEANEAPPAGAERSSEPSSAAMLPHIRPSEDTFPLITVQAARNTWSRSARRKKKGVPNHSPATLPTRSFSSSTTMNTDLPATGLQRCETSIRTTHLVSCNAPVRQLEDNPMLTHLPLVCSVGWISPTSSSADAVPDVDGSSAQQSQPLPSTLEFQWIRGVDRALFESFMGHVTRKVGAALPASSD